MTDIKRIRSSTVYDSQRFQDSSFQSTVYSSVTDYLNDLLILSQQEPTQVACVQASAKIAQHEAEGGTTLDFQLAISEKKANH